MRELGHGFLFSFYLQFDTNHKDRCFQHYFTAVLCYKLTGFLFMPRLSRRRIDHPSCCHNDITVGRCVTCMHTQSHMGHGDKMSQVVHAHCQYTRCFRCEQLHQSTSIVERQLGTIDSITPCMATLHSLPMQLAVTLNCSYSY